MRDKSSCYLISKEEQDGIWGDTTPVSEGWILPPLCLAPVFTKSVSLERQIAKVLHRRAGVGGAENMNIPGDRWGSFRAVGENGASVLHKRKRLHNTELCLGRKGSFQVLWQLQGRECLYYETMQSFVDKGEGDLALWAHRYRTDPLWFQGILLPTDITESNLGRVIQLLSAQKRCLVVKEAYSQIHTTSISFWSGHFSHFRQSSLWIYVSCD